MGSVFWRVRASVWLAHAQGAGRSDLSGHISHKNIPGVELSTGSLGHGLSVGAGMAYSAK